MATYTYSGGNDIFVVDVGDTVVFDDNIKWDQIRGIKTEEGRTTIVLNNYNVLNMYGTPSTFIIGGEIVSSEVYDNGARFYASNDDDSSDDTTVYTYGSGGEIILADTDDEVKINGVTQDQIRGIKVEDGRTTVAFDNYEVLNIYGTPASLSVNDVALDRATYDNGFYITPLEKVILEADEESIIEGYGDPADNVFEYKYGDGDAVYVADTNDVVDLNVSLDQVKGIKTDSDRTQIVMDNYQSVNVWGRAGIYVLDNTVYSTNEDGSWNEEYKIPSEQYLKENFKT